MDKIVSAEALYTGGNIWNFVGKLSNGKYFFLSTADDCGWWVDEDPVPHYKDLDEEWIAEHTNNWKNLIPEKQAYELFYKVIRFVGDDCDEDPNYYKKLARGITETSYVVDRILEGKDIRKALTESTKITPQVLKRIKDFAEEQFNIAGETGEQDGMVSVLSEKTGQDIIDPWIDSSGRFPLDDMGAVKEYGLPLVLTFCMMVLDKI